MNDDVIELSYHADVSYEFRCSCVDARWRIRQGESLRFRPQRGWWGPG